MPPPGSATSWPCAVTRQGGLGQPWVAHPEGLDHADELVSLVRGLGDFTVGVAAFPDGHPESGDVSEDAETLVRKERAGAEFAITQMVFDVDNYLRLRDELARRGSRLPVVPAIMPITNARQVVRMAQLAGQPMPAAVTDRLERHGGRRRRRARRGHGHRDRVVTPAARRGSTRHPLHHDEPIVSDPRGLRQPLRPRASPRGGRGRPNGRPGRAGRPVRWRRVVRCWTG